MKLKPQEGWWLDGRTDLKWWQHRHPDPRIRNVGALMMGFGLAQMVFGLAVLLKVI